eukprot:6803958-Prymnesium_polylepis.1
MLAVARGRAPHPNRDEQVVTCVQRQQELAVVGVARGRRRAGGGARAEGDVELLVYLVRRLEPLRGGEGHQMSTRVVYK